VPTDAEAEARSVLAELPFEISTNPGSWDFEPRSAVKRWWKLCIVGVLILYAVLWLIELLGFK
jgi:hypothetical protein